MNGILVPRERVEEAAPFLKKIWSDSDLRARLRVAAYEKVKREHDLDSFSTWFAEVARGAWNEAPRRWPDGKSLLNPEYTRSRRAATLRKAGETTKQFFALLARRGNFHAG